MLTGAIVGFGKVAEHTHLPAWKGATGARIVAVADPFPERRAAAAAALPGVRAYATAAELYAAERLDFVDLCTPPASHPEGIVEALRRGAHVVCEKPLAIDREGFGSIARAARESERVVYSVHNWKFAPLWRKVRAWLAGEEEARGEPAGIGPATCFTWSALRVSSDRGAVATASDWRLRPEVAGGGVFVDHGWHAFYLCQAAFGGARPRSVSARLWTVQEGLPLEDTAAATISYPGGEAQLFLSWAAGIRRNHGVITGQDGAILLEDERAVLLRRGREAVTWNAGEALSAHSHHPDWFGPVIEDFVRETREPAARGLSLREAEACLAILLAGRESAGRGSGPVEIGPA
ncbi:MAG: Gfo/Idh/MocA family oxidoreductase [Planctomycetes bacterium]|nr:Gfo/Idh/MocA family oxidoreductase [Planctomycetota bacterium]